MTCAAVSVRWRSVVGALVLAAAAVGVAWPVVAATDERPPVTLNRVSDTASWSGEFAVAAGGVGVTTVHRDLGTPSAVGHSHPVGGCDGSHWVGAWSMAPSDAAHPGFAEQTLRLVVHPHLGGDHLRLRLTNRFGSRPVTFDDVYVGLRESEADIVAGTNHAVTFGGQRSIIVPAGTNVISDPVTLSVSAGQDLAVSLYAPGFTGPATEHFLAMQDSFTTRGGSGNHAADEDGGAFSETITSWFFLEGVDVLVPRSVGAVVALGDSLTDGFVSAADLSPVIPGEDARGVNGRYPDHLARRLHQQPGPARLSVLNAGIGGNQVTSDGFLPQFGPSAVSRLEEDVLAQPGVTDVIVMEGTNDVAGAPLVSADDVIAGLDDIVRRSQAAGLNVVLGTIPPAEGAFPWVDNGSAMATAERNRINDWIRTRPHGVGVVDFHEALRDPANPDRLHPDYDSGDGLHLNLDGYRAMAEAVDLSLLAGSNCGPVAPRR